MNRLPAASGLLIAYRWASAQSLTSTQANYTLGIAGTLPLINCSMISHLVVQRSSRMDRQEPEQGKLPHDGKALAD